VTLDGQIGREKYQSVAGSLSSFLRFVDALLDTNETERPPAPGARASGRRIALASQVQGEWERKSMGHGTQATNLAIRTSTN